MQFKRANEILALAQLLFLIGLISISTAPGNARQATAKVGQATATPEEQFKQACLLYQKGQYLPARMKLDSLAATHPRDVSVQYYLGLSTVGTGDFLEAARIMAKVIVMSAPGTAAHTNAQYFFKGYQRQIGGIMPYSALNDGHIMHWTPKSMPLNIYVTHGLQLPSGYTGMQARDKKLSPISPFVRNKTFYERLQVSPGYKEDYYSDIRAGLSEWQFANSEGFLRYRLVDNPKQADIVVFWCPDLADKAGLTTYEPGSHVSIIQIKTKLDPAFPVYVVDGLLANTAAHEFGHAFGLPHSKNKKDVMSDSYHVVQLHWSGGVSNLPGPVSENDKATLRALYALPSDMEL